jgi:hypothetical protein
VRGFFLTAVSLAAHANFIGSEVADETSSPALSKRQRFNAINVLAANGRQKANKPLEFRVTDG